MKKVTVRLIDKNDKPVGLLEVDELLRKPGENYARRTAIRMGVKFIEPAADALDVSPATDWREVIA